MITHIKKLEMIQTGLLEAFLSREGGELHERGIQGSRDKSSERDISLCSFIMIFFVNISTIKTSEI